MQAWEAARRAEIGRGLAGKQAQEATEQAATLAGGWPCLTDSH